MASYLVRVLCVSCSKFYRLRVRFKEDPGIDVREGYCPGCLQRKIEEVEALQKGEGPESPKPHRSQGNGAF